IVESHTTLRLVTPKERRLSKLAPEMLRLRIQENRKCNFDISLRYLISPQANRFRISNTRYNTNSRRQDIEHLQNHTCNEVYRHVYNMHTCLLYTDKSKILYSEHITGPHLYL